MEGKQNLISWRGEILHSCLTPKTEKTGSIVLDDIGADFILDGDLLKIMQPPLGRDHRPV